MPDIQPSSGPHATAAGFGRRIASLCYEALLLAAVIFAAGWAFLPLRAGVPPDLVRPVLQLYLLAISAAYFVYCWTHGGQTLPMKTWRIRLTSPDGNGISARVALQRFLLAFMGMGFFGVGLWWALIDGDRQFLHDRILGTRLVRANESVDSPQNAGDARQRAPE